MGDFRFEWHENLTIIRHNKMNNGQMRAFQNALVQSDKIKLRLIKMAQKFDFEI